MKISYSNLWDSKANIFVVTTNGTLNSKHELVMGRGAAFQAKQRFPQLPVLAGKRIKQFYSANRVAFAYKYGFFTIDQIGLFQVKYIYDDIADLGLIAYSCCKLLSYIEDICGYEFKIHMNYPAIGYGGLKREKVEPIISTILPDNVTVHMYKE